MKCLCYILLCLISNSCREKKESENKDFAPQKEVPSYDTSKFNARVIPDTMGCMWLFKNRYILDTLFFEKAVIRITRDTFLTTGTRYRVLRPCSIPSFIAKPDDTILISGIVYIIYDFEYIRGYPTFINQIEYSKKEVLNKFQ